MKYTSGDWFVSGGFELIAMPSQEKISMIFDCRDNTPGNKAILSNAKRMYEWLLEHQEDSLLGMEIKELLNQINKTYAIEDIQ